MRLMMGHMSRALVLVLVMLVAAGSLLGVIWLTQRRLMYFPMAYVPAPDVVGLPDAERVTFRAADDVVLHGWFVPAPQPPASFTMLVFNGNAGNRGHRAMLARAFRADNLAVLLFDYRGFGDSAGAPGERGLAADARAARLYLQSRADVDHDRLVYFGESLGAAVAVDLAAEHPPAALVLRSPFTSMADLGKLHYPLLPVDWLLRDRFASIDRITQVKCPVLVVAGDHDRIVPLEQSRRLYTAISSRKALVVIEGADHNDADLTAGPAMITPVLRFLEQLREPGGPVAGSGRP